MIINQKQNQYAVGILTKDLAIQKAIQALEKADFPFQQVSIIATEPQDNNARGKINFRNYAGQGANKGALTGVILGSITGLLVGAGTIAIPMVGPIMLAEAITTTLVTTLTGSAIGVVTGGIFGSFIGLVIPKNKNSFSCQQWQYGDCLVIVEGTEEDLRHVNSILSKQSIKPWKIYNSLAKSNFFTPVTQIPQPQTI